MFDKKEFYSYFLGNMTAAQLGICLIFSMLTAFAMMLFRSTKKMAASEPTVLTNKEILFGDIKRFVATFIFVYFAIYLLQLGVKPNKVIYYSIGIGLVSDLLAGYAVRGRQILDNMVNKKLSNIEEKVDNVDIKIDKVSDKIDEKQS
jgi:hypothetical protein